LGGSSGPALRAPEAWRVTHHPSLSGQRPKPTSRRRPSGTNCARSAWAQISFGPSIRVSSRYAEARRVSSRSIRALAGRVSGDSHTSRTSFRQAPVFTSWRACTRKEIRGSGGGVSIANSPHVEPGLAGSVGSDEPGDRSALYFLT
jgi:hypothetical protein